ncbi:sigma-54-dependent transcriptional regulator [Marinobacterium aestuariivivens]|uniref:Sigma-54-dependent transcriptional regulator n=1 Tax=Marinobacterium aestuariivivens TaxID=1698799 RepID=A0ABW2AAL1_9GAMM
MEQAEKDLPDLSGLSLLVVDDDPRIVRGFLRVLRGLGAEVTGVGSVREARLSLAETLPDAVLADLQLKDGKGSELLPDFLGRHPDGYFYMITGHGSIDNAVAALRQGARHYFEKPVDPIALARQLAADLAGTCAGASLARQLEPYLSIADPTMVEALAELPRFAQSGEPVLIQGETGTGKELVARALHGLGLRAQGPFVAVNCGAIPETLLEAELFGFEKGAFTGAARPHRGRFEQAHRGTLLLDEIGEMPLAAQVSLLRVLEDAGICRIGGERGVPVDVRIIAATHQPLEERVEAGLFRQDLLYRLNVLLIQVPPLRQRPRDIELLARHFLSRSLRDMGWSSAPPSLTPEALSRLVDYHWPGNVRELRNLMARLAVRLPAGVREIRASLLASILPPEKAGRSVQDEGVFIPKGTSLADAEWLLIDAALKNSGYNRVRAARLLGIGERTLRRKLNES